MARVEPCVVAWHPGVSHCKHPSHLPWLALKTLELEHRVRQNRGKERVMGKEGPRENCLDERLLPVFMDPSSTLLGS